MTPLGVSQDGALPAPKPLTPVEQQVQNERRRELELELLRNKARTEGHEAGYQAGFTAARDEGYAAGLAAGREDGLQQLQEQTRAALAPLQHLAANFTQALQARDEEIGEQVAALALKISRLVVGKHLQANPDQIRAIVKQLLHHEPELTGKPRLHLHPQDYTLVKKHLATDLESAGWTLRSDDLITQGGCRVLSNSGDLDATMETRWSQIEAEYTLQGIGS
jgi:flagellar assembly protein FliH